MPMSEFRMPSLGADMAAGTLVEWKVKPGDHVERGAIVAEVETDKGIVEVEIFEDAIIDTILVEPSTKVPVGEVLALLRHNGAEAPPAGHEPPAPPDIAPRAPVVQKAPVPALAPAEHERVRISPVARRLAAELNVDLATVTGSGPHGAIERVDVERASVERKAASAPPVAAPPTAPARPAVDTQAAMRRAIAAAMARSNRDIPHYYLETRIDMSRPLRWLEAENQKRSVRDRLLSVVLLIKAVARALADIPELNGYWIDDMHQPQEAIHIGFAIALRQGGLVTPAIHHADLKSLDELMEALRDLITRVRSGRLRSSELTDSTVTVTNLGDMGVEKVYGVIYPPQVALIGFGKITEQPWAENGMLGIRPVLTATLAGDHRATDGRRGAQFLEALTRHLQEAEKL